MRHFAMNYSRFYAQELCQSALKSGEYPGPVGDN